MIAHRTLLKSVLFTHFAIAYILPRQTYLRSSPSFALSDILNAVIAKSSFSNANTTSPPYPNITPGGALSVGNTAVRNCSVCGTKVGSHIPNGTTVEVSVASGSTNVYANASANASLCFFVVQDTMNIRFWTEYSTVEHWATFTVTSLINEVTQYIDTVVTNKATSIKPTQTISKISEDQLANQNYAPKPLRAIEALNETVVTSWGRTFTSPASFYIYSTVEILAVPAITLSNGQSACATAITSTYFETYGTSSRPLSTETILPSGNSKVYEYFDGDISSSFATSLPTHAPKQKSALLVGIDTAETTLTFATPYIYSPDLSDDYGFEDYGYIPQLLIDSIARNPDITSGFPSHASFVPGGPSISTENLRWMNKVEDELSAKDLTISTAFTVTSAGCFHPDACQLHDPQGTTTTMPPTAHNLIQSPAFTAVVPTQAVKTRFPSSLINPQRESSALAPSKAASTGSANKDYPLAIAPIVASNSDATKNPLAGSLPAIPVITVGSLVISANSALEFVLGSQTLSPDGDPIIFSSTTYFLAPSATAVVVNGVSSALIPVKLQRLKAATADVSDGLSYLADGSNIEIANYASAYIVGGQTVVPGSAPILVSGTTYSLDSSASTIFVNNIAIPLPKFEEPHAGFAAVLSIGSLRFTANAASEYIVAGQTLSPAGSPIVVSGTTYSLAGQASALVLNGVTSTLLAHQKTNLRSRPFLSIGSLRLTADDKSDYILDSQTLSPGGRPIVVSGTTYSLGPQASILVINGVTSTLPAEEAAKPTPGPVIKIGSQYLTPDAALRYAFGSKTLIPNARPIVISGTTYSLAPQASALMVNGVKSTLHGHEALPTVLAKNTLTKYQVDYIVGSQILSPGAPAITISGIAISLAASGNTIVIDSSTLPFPTKTAPSFAVGSQLITATAVSHLIAGDETLTSNGNTDIRSLALDLTSGSNSSPFPVTTSEANGNKNSGSVSKSEASRRGPGLVEQVLGVLLGVLGLALL